MKRLRWLVLLMIALGPAERSQAQYRQSAHGPAFEPPPPKAIIQRVGVDQRLNAPLPMDTVFRDETGKDVRLRDCFRGRPVVLALVYYECPMLCTMELNGLTGSLKTMSLSAGKDFDVLTVSFDPTERPALAAEKKARYVRDYNRPDAAGGWHFLTGDENSIRQLTDAVGFHYYKDPATGQYAHASAIFVITPQGTISKYFYGIEYSPRDLRLALVEASQGKIGSTADALTLLCYQYDPAKARYGLAIMSVLRGGGVLTLGLIGGFVAWHARRERKPPRAQEGTP